MTDLTQEVEREEAVTEVSRLRVRSLLMRLIKTKDVLDVEHLSVRGLWAVSRDVQEAARTDIWSSREGWAAGALAVVGVLVEGSCSRGVGWRMKRDGVECSSQEHQY